MWLCARPLTSCLSQPRSTCVGEAECSGLDCHGPVLAKGLCRRHYMRGWRLAHGITPRRPGRGSCGTCRSSSDRLRLGLCPSCYRQASRDRLNDLHRRWSHAHPDQIRLWTRQQQAARRAAIRADGFVSYRIVLERHGLTCHLCSEEIRLQDLHFDHVIPLSRGGVHTAGNIRPAHSGCNLRKGTKLVPETPVLRTGSRSKCRRYL
jgi:5-methylcytosine-specific restriction endonuclease McrA